MTPPPSSTPRPVPPALVRDLRRRLGRGAVLTDPDRLIVYEADGLPHYRRTPSAVVLPLDTDETSWAVGRLHEAGIPVVPRGAGTGLSGGALAAPGSVVLGTARMRRILALEPANRRARVQAGVLNADLSAAASPHGLHYAPDPSSQTACTLGGNVAENSGGPHCLKYGVTSRYVTGLIVVGPGGGVVELGGDAAPPSPDLVGLFVGSEGCFGIATEIELRLVPVARGVRTLLAAFERLEEAGSAVSEIIARGLLPAALEILDRATITAVEESIFAAGYPRDAGAVLVVEFDGTEAELDAEADVAEAICRDHGAAEVRRAREEGERAQLWKGRKKAFGAMGRLAPDMMVQDATVPRSRLPAVLARIGAIARDHDLHVANVFHAGDGNLHPNILFDRRDPAQKARVEVASHEIMVACVDAGGTITGEHGVGLDKRGYMELVHGPAELQALDAVRRVFDPHGLWNPGKVLPDGVPAASHTEASPDPGRRRPDAGILERLDGLDRVERDGAGYLVRPRDEGAVAGLLSRASAEGWRVAPAGSREVGSSDLALDTRGLEGIVEYEPADLTLTAGGGTPLAELSRRTARAGQWLALDAPGLAEATLGGVVARGLAGALATSHGALRDLVLGLTLVTGDGRVLRLGGRVVKNVAGFDLVRLVVGSRGALGIITSVTVRLHPRPRADRTWIHRGDRPESLVTAAARVASMDVPPASLELGWGPDGAVLAVRALGSVAGVADFGNRLEALLPSAESFESVEGDRARRNLRLSLDESAARVRLAGGAGGLDALLARVRLRAEEAGAPFRGWMLVDRGVAWVGLPEGAAPDGTGGELPGGAREWAWGLKRVFDPAGILPSGPFPSERRPLEAS